MSAFKKELLEFLRGLCGESGVVPGPVGTKRCVVVDDGPEVFCCANKGLAVVAVPLDFFERGGTVGVLDEVGAASGLPDRVFVYEDRWLSCGPLVRDMLRVRMGAGLTVFARNCEVRKITQEAAAAFLERNHVYGNTRSVFRLGLFRQRSTGRVEAGMDQTPVLVAVAAFSAGRRMSDGTMSYEWVRYASCRGLRVVGGMGRLLDAFVRNNGAGGSFEVMSYCDLEWYDGRSYLRLGFRDEGRREPVAFLYLPSSGLRVHERKLSADRRFRGMDVRDGIRLYNMGSRRYVLGLSGSGSGHVE